MIKMKFEHFLQINSLTYDKSLLVFINLSAISLGLLFLQFLIYSSLMTWSQEHIMPYFLSLSPHARGIQAFQKRKGAASLWHLAYEHIRYVFCY